MMNRLLLIFIALSKYFYKNRRQRREAIERTYPFVEQIDKLMLVAIFTVPTLLPLLIDLTYLFNIPAWLWWMKTFAWLIAVVWFVARLSVTLFHAPGQLASATVDAMEQTTLPVDPAFSGLTEPVEVECLPYTKPLETAEQKIGRQSYWRLQWRRPGRRLLFGVPIRRQLPHPAHPTEIYI